MARLVVLAICCSLAAAGCGGSAASGDETPEQVRATLHRYFVALRDGDGAATCGALTATGRRWLTSAFARSAGGGAPVCEEAIVLFAGARKQLEAAGDREGTVQRLGLELGVNATSTVDGMSVERTGDRATVTIDVLPEHPTMRRVDGRWLIDGFGD
ncbi:hypothetical protein [Patulibacter minatonensis]|uniref:hypothetical protein n=1 Tax=Patulibacter minatonensis TaxID=298163 RepID=UPI0012FA0D0B|nr:hypothetical protein [Patulibacter minatonensis]